MAYYTALINEWPSLTGATEQKLAAVNAMTVAGPNVGVSISQVVGYLALNGKLSGLMKYAAAPPATEAGLAAAELVALMQLGTNAPAFDMGQPSVYATVSGMLNALAGDAGSGISSSDVTNLLALAATTIPWWQANGYTGPFTDADLEAAGGLT